MMKKLFIPIIFIGVVLTFGYAIFSIGSIDFLQLKTYNGWNGNVQFYYYEFNALEYIQNLTKTGTQALNNLAVYPPKGNFGLNMDHNFSLLIQWLTFYLSIITWPIRVIATIYTGILSLLGIDLTINPSPFAQWLTSWVYVKE